LEFAFLNPPKLVFYLAETVIIFLLYLPTSPIVVESGSKLVCVVLVTPFVLLQVYHNRMKDVFIDYENLKRLFVNKKSKQLQRLLTKSFLY